MRRFYLFFLVLLCSVSTYGQGLNAVFSSSDTMGCAPAAISFTDLSTGSPTSWIWDFGDGSTSTLQNPTHTFTTNGWYGVNLTISDGTNTDSWTMWLNLNGPEIYGINPNNNLLCGPGPLVFEAFVDSFIAPLSYSWTATGPVTLTSTDQFPTLNFPLAGTYTVELVTDDGNGCTDMMSIQVVIPDGIVTNTSTTPENCGNSDGTASVTASGGTAPLVYTWSNGATTPTQTGLTAGFYTVATTDGNGCSVINTVEVLGAGLDVVPTIFNPSCEGDSNGYITLDIVGGTAPYTYTWNGAAGSDSLGGLGEGAYAVEVTDAAGCVTGIDITLENSTLSLALATTDADCSGAGGDASVSVSGGVSPYTYLWSTGATTSSITGAPAGYSVAVTDNSGCSDHEIVYIEYADSCLVTLSGRTYFDVDQDCVYDSTDFAIPALITFSNGTSVMAGFQGQYSAQVEPGTYAVSYNASLFPIYNVICPTTGTYLLNNVTTNIGTLDFAFYSDSSVQDLRVYVYKGNVRPGFDHFYWLWVYNDGPVPSSGVLTLEHDALVNFVSSNPTADSYDPAQRQATWNIPSIGPGQGAWFHATGFAPLSTPLGIPVSSIATINPIAGDLTPTNNVDSCSRITTNSYDPNDKQVEPAGTGPEGYITQEQRQMLYTIRFQNTGTDTAFVVVIRDTIETDLDISTFKPATTSHTYDLTMEDNVLIFTFNDIYLVDSVTNEPLSHGHVSFQMDHNGTLPYDAEIRNSAAIYFDFNDPIITNEVLNTIQRPTTGISDELLKKVQLFPNPSTGTFVIAYEDLQAEAIEVLDMTGRVLLKRSANPSSTQVSLADWPSGNYLLRVLTKEGAITKKLTLTK